MTEQSTGPFPLAVTKAYDLLLWMIGHVGEFPRSHRFVLGERIETRQSVHAEPVEAWASRSMTVLVPSKFHELLGLYPALRRRVVLHRTYRLIWRGVWPNIR